MSHSTSPFLGKASKPMWWVDGSSSSRSCHDTIWCLVRIYCTFSFRGIVRHFIDMVAVPSDLTSRGINKVGTRSIIGCHHSATCRFVACGDPDFSVIWNRWKFLSSVMTVMSCFCRCLNSLFFCWKSSRKCHSGTSCSLT